MPNCAVPGCSANGVHLFPKDETLKKKWEFALCRENYVATQHSRICRNHFLDSDYVVESAYTGKKPQIRKVLKQGAIPSIFSWSSLESPIPTSTKYEASDNKEEFEVCRVCLALDVKMYDMKNFKLSEMFESITGILDSDENSTKSQHICWECAARLKAAAAFKEKALLSDTLLKDHIHVTKSDIAALKENHTILNSHLTIHTPSNYMECEYTESEMNNKADLKEEEETTRVNKDEIQTEYQENEPWIELPLQIKIECDSISDNDVNSNDGQDYEETTNVNIETNNEMANVLIIPDVIEQKPSLDNLIRIDFESQMKETIANKANEELVNESSKKRYKMTNRIKEKILEMKNNGVATRKIADETGLSVNSIDCWWSRYRKTCIIYQKNLKIKRNQQNTADNYEYKPEPGKELEECSPVVRQRLHEAGLEHILMKKPEKNPGTMLVVSDRKSQHDNLKKRIIALKQEGITNTRIAYLLDTSPITVRKWWSRWCDDGDMENQSKWTSKKRKNSRSTTLETDGEA